MRQEIFKAQRVRAGLTQGEIAKLMGVGRSTVYLVEKGSHKPSPRFRTKAYKVLSEIFPEITMDDIFYLPEVFATTSSKDCNNKHSA